MLNSDGADDEVLHTCIFSAKILICLEYPYFSTITKLTTVMGITVGLLIPLLGTMLSAAFVFFMKKDMSTQLQKSLLGFARHRHPEHP